MVRPGFTVIELIITIAIFAVLAASTFGLAGRLNQKGTFQDVEENILNTLEEARDRAMKGEQGSAWGVAFETGSVILYAGNAYALHTAALDRRQTVPAAYSFSGLREVTFRKLTGKPFTGGTITTRHAEEGMSTITVNEGGGIFRQ